MTDGDPEVEESHAVIFPWFVEFLGLLVFFIIAKWIKILPYTAVMFVIGMCMGIGAVRSGSDDQLSESILMWSNIDSEVLLLVFLPGLIFRDALNINFHLFTVGLLQILILAFPMVLAGTVLTALVGFYVFPYGWSWFFALTFGSILSATDPVAVAALLAEVGAPPRLTMHIAGESMFNDGSAMVFFNIFSGIFLYELGIEGLGAEVTFGEGFAIFFQLSLGGVAIGLAFAIGLVFVLYVLDHRLDKENNVIQVAATVTVAYLTFYTSEVAAGCSGVIAVVICGITTRAFGGGFINDPQMMEDFWVLLEHLLNTLLFTLGGVTWGTIIANSDERDNFSGTDWGYLIALYILLNIIRFVLVGAFYPLLSRIGLKSNWQEAAFLSYGGLRGAVGIALSIAVDNDVRGATTDPELRAFTNKLFGMVGGVALLTLVINGTTAGPVLVKLGLTKSTEAAKKISEHYERCLKKNILHEYAIILNDPRFEHCCSYKRIRFFVKYLDDLTDEEINFAKEQAREFSDLKEKLKEQRNGAISEIRPPTIEGTDSFGKLELRLLFLELLRASYELALEDGHLDARIDKGFISYSLIQSLDFAADEINRGGTISDWKYANITEAAAINNYVDRLAGGLMSKDKGEIELTRKTLLKAFTFQTAHQRARQYFQSEFLDDVDNNLAEAAKIILKESEEQESLANEILCATDKLDLEIFYSHHACTVLLNKAAYFVNKHCQSGMIKEQEAHGFLEDIDEAIKVVHTWTIDHTSKIHSEMNESESK